MKMQSALEIEKFLGCQPLMTGVADHVHDADRVSILKMRSGSYVSRGALLEFTVTSCNRNEPNAVDFHRLAS